MSNKIEKVKDPADPNRCQHVQPHFGQCLNIASANGVCIAHGGADQTDHERTYALTRFRARLNKFADDPKIKKLNEEIGILRMLLENVLNQISDDVDMIAQSSTIAELVTKIQGVVIAADKLDQRHGQLLDKSVLLRFAVAVVDIIAEEVGDPQIQERIGSRIMETLGDTQKPEELS